MKQTPIILALIAAALLIGPARADTTEDDIKWVNQCIADNKKEGATEDVVRKYCVCMNNAMSNSETKSISIAMQLIGIAADRRSPEPDSNLDRREQRGGQSPVFPALAGRCWMAMRMSSGRVRTPSFAFS
jgi:hypothetical protein